MARRIVRARPAVRGRSARPGGTWSRFQSIGVGSAASTKTLLATFALSNPGIGETVRRTVGSVNFSSDQTGALETPLATFGMIVVSDAAAAIGVTAIPGPGTDSSDDGWFVWQGLAVGQGPSTVGQLNSQQFPFDSRAMRRNEEGFLVAVMLETGLTFGSITQVSLSLYATRH